VIAVVPFGHVVPVSWSTTTWVPLIAALVQQPWITPELSTGPPVIAAPAEVPAASRANALTVLMKMVRACSLLIVSSCLSWLIREATHGRVWPVGCGPGLIGGGEGLGRG
jgi:hypothetical protein